MITMAGASRLNGLHYYEVHITFFVDFIKASGPAGVHVKDLSSIMPAHPSQGVDQPRHCCALSVPSLPQVEDRLGGARLGGEEGSVPGHPKPLCQLAPVCRTWLGWV